MPYLAELLESADYIRQHICRKEWSGDEAEQVREAELARSRLEYCLDEEGDCHLVPEDGLVEAAEEYCYEHSGLSSHDFAWNYIDFERMGLALADDMYSVVIGGERYYAREY